MPPSLHFERAEPADRFRGQPVLREHRPAGVGTTEATPRRAGVSSFGIGGTNAHVVLEEAPAQAELTASDQAQSPARPVGADAAGPRRAPPSGWRSTWPRIRTCRPRRCRLHAAGRPARRSIIAGWWCAVTPRTRSQRLSAAGGKRAISGAVAAQRRPACAFMFPGQGAQHVNMAREALRTRAGVPRGGRRVRRRCLRRILGRRPGRRRSIRRRPDRTAAPSGAERNPADAAGAVRDRVRAGPALAALGHRARGDDRAQHRRVRGRLPGRRLLAARRAAAGRGARPADAAAAGRLDDGGADAGRRGRARCWDPGWRSPPTTRPGLCVVSGESDAVDRLEAALATPQGVHAPPAHLARLSLAHDGRRAGRVPAGGRACRPAAAAAAVRVERHRHLDHEPGGDRSRRTGPATCASRCDSRPDCARCWRRTSTSCWRWVRPTPCARWRHSSSSRRQEPSRSHPCRIRRKPGPTREWFSRRWAGCGRPARPSTGRRSTRASAAGVSSCRPTPSSGSATGSIRNRAARWRLAAPPAPSRSGRTWPRGSSCPPGSGRCRRARPPTPLPATPTAGSCSTR